MYRVLFLIAVLLSSLAFAESNSVVRVGVATMENQAGRSVPPDVERDRLVRAINQLKPDKKTHLKLEAVPLDGSSGNELADQAAQKNCDYVVYTTLTELRQSGDPYQHRPGTIETNPNGVWNNRTPEGQAMDPEYRATVEYKLYNVKAHSTIAGAPYSNQGSGNEVDTVSQIMDRIANSVFSEIKKGGSSAPMQE
jgi:hypothetical protein